MCRKQAKKQNNQTTAAAPSCIVHPSSNSLEDSINTMPTSKSLHYGIITEKKQQTVEKRKTTSSLWKWVVVVVTLLTLTSLALIFIFGFDSVRSHTLATIFGQPESSVASGSPKSTQSGETRLNVNEFYNKMFGQKSASAVENDVVAIDTPPRRLSTASVTSKSWATGASEETRRLVTGSKSWATSGGKAWSSGANIENNNNDLRRRLGAGLSTSKSWSTSGSKAWETSGDSRRLAVAHSKSWSTAGARGAGGKAWETGVARRLGVENGKSWSTGAKSWATGVNEENGARTLATRTDGRSWSTGSKGAKVWETGPTSRRLVDSKTWSTGNAGAQRKWRTGMD